MSPESFYEFFTSAVRYYLKEDKKEPISDIPVAVQNMADVINLVFFALGLGATDGFVPAHLRSEVKFSPLASMGLASFMEEWSIFMSFPSLGALLGMLMDRGVTREQLGLSEEDMAFVVSREAIDRMLPHFPMAAVVMALLYMRAEEALNDFSTDELVRMARELVKERIHENREGGGKGEESGPVAA